MNLLYIRKDSDFVRVKNYPDYAAAVTAGQDLAPRNFYVDTGDRIPTREEQLLIPVDMSPRERRLTLLATI